MANDDVISNGDLDHFCTCTELFCRRCEEIMHALKRARAKFKKLEQDNERGD